MLALFLLLLPRPALADVIVQNNCLLPVYYRRVQGDNLPIEVLGPGAVYREGYRFVYALNPATGTNDLVGTVFKMTPNASIGHALTEEARTSAFDGSGILQFEYSYDPASVVAPTNVWYDISEVNDGPVAQFCHWGISLESSNKECTSFSCPPGCGQYCPFVYNTPDENAATHGCTSSDNLTLTLCMG